MRARIHACGLSCVLLCLAFAGCAVGFPVSRKTSQAEALLLFFHLRTEYYSKFLFVVGGGDTTFRSFGIDETTGALTQISVMTPPGSGIGLDVHPTLPYVYQSLNSTNGVTSFSFDQSTGVLTLAQSVNPGNANSHRVRIPQDGTAMFFHTLQAGVTRTYRSTLTSGSMGAPVMVENTLVANSQFMNLEPQGRFLYTANNAAFGINMYQTNGASTLISRGNLTINGAEQPVNGVFNSAGTALYIVTGTRLVAYAIDQTTGVLTALSSDLTAANNLVLLPSERFVYAFEPGNFLVRIYRVNADRSLTFLSSQAAGATSYDSSCVHRGGRFIFLAKTTNPAALLVYKVMEDGTLVLSSSIPSIGNNMFHCATSIDSRPLWP